MTAPFALWKDRGRRCASTIVVVWSILAAPAAFGAPDLIRTSSMAIERSNPAVWPAAYERLFTSLRERYQSRLQVDSNGREIDKIALRYLDRALLDEAAEQAEIATVVGRIVAPELRALGYVSLARWGRTERWLRPAVEALKSAPTGSREVDAIGRVLADTAMDLGEIELATEAIALVTPGPVRAAALSKLARLKGGSPEGHESWPDQVKTLEARGDLQGAILLATSADAWKHREERDEILGDLARRALQTLGAASAISAADAIYSLRMQGTTLRDITEELIEQGRIAEATVVARRIGDPRAGSSAWLMLAKVAGSEVEQTENLRRAVDLALAVNSEPERSDALADALKRLAEHGQYSDAFSLAKCISVTEERDRVIAASAKRAAEMGDVASSERMLSSLAKADSEASQRARKALNEAKKKSSTVEHEGETESATLIDMPPACARLWGAQKKAALIDHVTPAVGPVSLEGRRAELTHIAASTGYSYCTVPDAELDLQRVPVTALSSTEEYGSDQSAEHFSWNVMVLTGRHLAGDSASGEALARLLVRWAEAGAFLETTVAHDAYYALKRTLLPTVVAFTLIASRMPAPDEAIVRSWLDMLVRRVDERFNGDVDRNNHRYLSDSVQMTWGSWIGDRELFRRGVEALDMARGEMRADGSLPLEVRRGSRALWYMRQAASSITLMLHLLERQGFSDIADEYRESLLLPVVEYLVNGIHYPTYVLASSAENYIPGPEEDYFEQDLGFLEARGHGRHYMAWTELLLSSGGTDPTTQRLRLLSERRVFDQRPLIDEFAGGNATCFWATTTAAKGGHG